MYTVETYTGKIEIVERATDYFIVKMNGLRVTMRKAWLDVMEQLEKEDSVVMISSPSPIDARSEYSFKIDSKSETMAFSEFQ